MISSPTRKRRFYGWTAWAAATCFYFYQFILRVSPSVMGPELMQYFQIDAYELGWFSGLFYFSYSLLQIPLGICLDLIGPRKMILGSASCALLGLLIFALSNTILMAAVGRLLIGAGSACGFLGSMKIASSWFKPTVFAILVGITSFIGVIGAMIGSAPLAVLVTHLGWRESVFWLLALGFLVLGLLVAAVRDNPRDHHVRTPAGFFNIFTRPAIWLIGAFGLAVYSPITVVADLWGTQFMATLFNIPAALAASSVSLIYIGFGLGAFMVGWISQGIRDWRRFFFGTALSLALILGVIVWFPKPNIGLISILMLLLGFVGAGECLIFPAGCRLAPLAYSGTVTGFVNMFTMLGGTILQPLVGYVMRWSWNGSSLDGAPVYTARDYQTGLTAVLFLLGFAACSTLFMDHLSGPEED